MPPVAIPERDAIRARRSPIATHGYVAGALVIAGVIRGDIHPHVLQRDADCFADAARAAMRAHLSESQQRYRERLTDQQAEYRFGSTAAR